MGLLEALLDGRDLVDLVLLGLPLGLHGRAALAQVAELALDRLAALDARVVGLLGQRGELDLELQDAAVDLVDLGRQRVDLDAQPGGGLVDEVDGLVGQEAVGDVAVAERRRGDQRGVLDAHAVVDLVALLEAAQDRDRVLDGRLADEHGLEAALERGVLLDVLAVLVERRGADGAQLAAGEHRLEQVGGVDGALGGAGADDRVQLVDEEDDRAAGVLDLVEDGLQALLELAAVLRAGQQRADVQRDDAPVAQRLGHVAGHDALGEALDDRGLADAGLADEHRVVLRAAAEDLDDAADLVVAADDRVELALLGLLGQVAPELLQRLVLVLGATGRSRGGARGPRRSPWRSASLLAPAARSASPAREGWAASASSRCSVETYSSLRLAHLLLGLAQDADELARRAGGLAAGGQRRHARRAAALTSPRSGAGVGAELGQHRHDDAAVLLEQHGEQVLGRHLRVAAALGELAGRGDGLLGLDGESISLHKKSQSGRRRL